MALNTAITDREVIGFTNQPWLRVYCGTGLYGSYFSDWWAACRIGGLGGNEKLVQEGVSEQRLCSRFASEKPVEIRYTEKGWILKPKCPKQCQILALGVKWTVHCP